MILPVNLKNKLKPGISLLERTSFKIGGQAKYWFEPKDKTELSIFLKYVDKSLPFFIIGAGSNLLIKEGIINKVFISLRKSEFSKIQQNKNILLVGAGVRLNSIISFLRGKCFGGYEFLSGIPGTVGGAIVMNAGARNDYNDKRSLREMKDIVSFVDIMDKKGNLKRLSKNNIKFFYRGSSLKRYILVSAGLKFYNDNSSEVSSRIIRNLKLRHIAQDWRYPSAGSFFKNPSGRQAAAQLIDDCGLKGVKVGGAMVSEKHANFIVNVKSAKSSDVLKLMEIIRKKVYNRFKIMLEPEVQIVS